MSDRSGITARQVAGYVDGLHVLHEIWQEANRVVLNDEDASARHQRIEKLAHDALVAEGVLNE